MDALLGHPFRVSVDEKPSVLGCFHVLFAVCDFIGVALVFSCSSFSPLLFCVWLKVCLNYLALEESRQSSFFLSKGTAADVKTIS